MSWQLPSRSTLPTVAALTGLVALSALPLACGNTDDTADTADARLLSETGSYELFVSMNPDPPVAGDTMLMVMIHDADSGDMLMGSALSVTPWMVEHDHGINDEPVVTEDQGTYTVTFAYSMPGTWQLTLDIDGELGIDSMVMDVEVQ